MRAFVLGPLLTMFALGVMAGDCKRTGVQCVDTTPSKVISGFTVTLAQVGGCWEYQDTYDCIKPDFVDYCAPLASLGCTQTSSACSSSNFNSGCMVHEQTYRCASPAEGLTDKIVQLDDTYTLSQQPGTACNANQRNPRCQLMSRTCMDSTPCRVDPTGATVCLKDVAGPAGALYINDTCWSWQNDYGCLSDFSDCQPLVEKGCSAQSRTCTLADASGACQIFQNVYSCVTKAGTTTTEEDCSVQALCLGASCFDAVGEADKDFGKAAAMKEAAREAGLYGVDSGGGVALFGGFDNRCTKKSFMGLIGKNCCNSKGGGATNHSIASTAISQALGGAMSAAGPVITNSSKYLFDTLYHSDNAMLSTLGFKGLELVSPYHFAEGVGNLPTSIFEGANPSVSVYGLTVSYGEPTAGMMASVFGASASGASETVASAVASAQLAQAQAQNLMSAAGTMYSAAEQAYQLAPTLDNLNAVNAASDYVTAAVANYDVATQGLSSVMASSGSVLSDMYSLYSAGSISMPLGTTGLTFSFNPYAFAAQLAFNMIMEWLSCDQNESILAIKRGNNLCHFVGSFCSSKLNLLLAKICIETTESYCCYNSRLAKLINEQGRAQIGKGWGSGESPACGGFSEDEFARIDFSLIDFSSFAAEMAASVTTPDVAGMTTQATTAITNRAAAIQ